MTGLHYIFVYYAASAGLACLLSIGIGNTSLRRKKEAKQEQQDVASASALEGGELVVGHKTAISTESESNPRSPLRQSSEGKTCKESQ
jgi:hypothetical protein